MTRGGRRAERLLQWAADPRLLAPVLALIGIPLVSTQPHAGLGGPDVSWQLGVSLAIAQGHHFGSALAFTYGPLAFLAVPNDVFLPGAVFGILYLFVAGTAFYYFFTRWLTELVPPAGVILVAAASMIVWSSLKTAVPELVVAAVALGALWVVHPEHRASQLHRWVAPVIGGVAALQLQVKFSSGLVCVALAILVAVAGEERIARVGSVLAAFFAALVGLWLLSGQLIGQLGTWLWLSTQIAVGYNDAMSSPLVGPSASEVTWLVVVLSAVLVAGAGLMVRQWRGAALISVLVTGGTAWYFVKQGLVRFDPIHSPVAFLGLGALVVTLPWTGRRLAVGLSALVGCLAGTVLATFGGYSLIHGFTETTSSFRSQRSTAMSTAVDVVHQVIDPAFHTSRLADARQTMQRQYGVSPDVVDALRRTQVQADPWDIGAVWAYGLAWRPAPIFQTYSAYTADLDDRNARSLLARSRIGVLRAPAKQSGGRVASWESPQYETTMACSFSVVAAEGPWQAVRRAPTVCGAPVGLGRVEVSSGHTVPVPRARRPDDLVVATMTFDQPIFDRLLSFAFKPVRTPMVRLDGQRSSLVVGTMGQDHLLRVPVEVGGRRLPSGGLAVDRLGFLDVPGPVTVRFYEVPIHANR